MTNNNEDKKLLEIDGVHTYYGPSHVLKGVSFDVKKEEIVTIIGRNGAGKTTTIRSILGLTSPEEGIIKFEGNKIQGLDVHEIRNLGISWVPEKRRIFPHLTVSENLRVANHLGTDSKIKPVYDRFSRLEDRRNQLAGSLSGGEQQMLAIGRALAGPQTDLLLLDEPTEGLAPQIQEDVKDVILELNSKGMTIVLVEQNAEISLKTSDRAYILEQGEIRYEGPSSEVVENRQILEKYMGVI